MIRNCHTQGSYIEWGELDGVFPAQKNMINLKAFKSYFKYTDKGLYYRKLQSSELKSGDCMLPSFARIIASQLSSTYVPRYCQYEPSIDVRDINLPQFSRWVKYWSQNLIAVG